MSPASIGVGLRVTGHCSQGGRKYMEDFFSVAYQQSVNEKELEYAFFGIYDGHGGSEAAIFAKEHLMLEIVNQKLFWSDCDQDVLRAIREGYIATHYAMWREQEKWPKTATGLPSTAGTTATVAFIRKGKIYIGHVGDSGVVLGYQEPGESFWRSKPLTKDHKPECNVEKARIINSGGKVITKSGVPRVVWNRPRIGHKGPVRRSTPIDEIPFLAVARSLGDLWSYNSANDQFVVSPDPDVKVVKIDPKTFRCLVFGTDGLWNVISASEAVSAVRDTEAINERLSSTRGADDWLNPSKSLVDRALETWSRKKMRADNTSVVTILMDPPNCPRREANNSFTTSSCGLEYTQVEAEIRPTATADYLHPFPEHAYSHMYESSMNNSHQIHEVYNPLPVMTDPYCINEDGTSYNSATNCDTNNYVYYENIKPSNEGSTYMNSFAESYNSLLISNLESNNSSSSSSSASNHNYQSLTGYDHIQDTTNASDHKKEQREYQQECMSAEEGYCLTKLETRGEQQLRYQSSSSSIQTFQVFSEDATSSYSQYDNITSSYEHPMASYNVCDDDNANSNFLMQGVETAEEVYKPNFSECTTIRPHEFVEIEPVKPEDFVVEADAEMDNETKKCVEQVEKPVNNDTFHHEVESEMLDESIQIHEISSSGAPLSPASPSTSKEAIKPAELRKHQQSERTTRQTTQNDKMTTAKRSFPNVPNENRSNQSQAVEEKRQLRSKIVDYSKRTLRSRNSLSKDLKAKSVTMKPTLHQLRRAVVHNQFLKTTVGTSTTGSSSSSTQSTNAKSAITNTGLNLRSRQICWPSENQPNPKRCSARIYPVSSAIATTKSAVGRTHLIRQSAIAGGKPKNFSSSTPANTSTSSSSVTSSSSSVKVIKLSKASVAAVKASPPPPPMSPSSSVSSSTTTISKRSIRNSAWCSGKNTVQTRNRVQKRLSH